MLTPQNFAAIANPKLKESGLEVGDLVYIAGHRPVQEEEDRPYDLRVKFYICRLTDEGIDTSQFMVVDPMSLTEISDEEQESLKKSLKEFLEGETKH